ncbi:hypothetical protein K2173_006114 [Erythroxylum novogranatense]|uniref:Uncharacterized protein n=1 Tax=Erythroxylum novogranatense TaxID=1862640 RepID=A0AAV8TDW0_9ROSI|nr:hypothetical protein K2173_006114 [Erythroxylum novogranatense]
MSFSGLPKQGLLSIKLPRHSVGETLASLAVDSLRHMQSRVAKLVEIFSGFKLEEFASEKRFLILEIK